MVGFWATVSLNIPDFTRYARSQRAQVLGQAIGLPATMTFYSFIGIAVTSATLIIFGQALWDPVAVLSRLGNPFAVILAMLALLMATLNVNVAANVVSPANDFSNLSPRHISFRLGGLITCFVGIAMQPWKLMANYGSYIFGWLVGYSGFLGPIAGVMICDYFVVRKKILLVQDLYQRDGLYEYQRGFNWQAVIPLAAGAGVAFIGLFMPQLRVLYNYAWFVGFFVSFLVYFALMHNRAAARASRRLNKRQNERSTSMEFGITIKPDLTVERIVNLTRQAESVGFRHGWIFDSHVIWMEPFPLMTLMAANTKKMRLGPCVTNPAVRDVTVASSLFATLNSISNGRMQMGIGRGDSSRRVLGKKPTTLEHLEQFVKAFRELNAGKTIDHDGVATTFPWTNKKVPPVWVAGYGPKALRTAGRIGDGVILQFADPDLIEWCLGFVREGAKEAGRDFSKIEVMAAAPVWASERSKSRPRSSPLVPGARFESRDGSHLQIQARRSPAFSHILRQRPRLLRLSPSLRSRQRQRRFRQRRSHRPLLPRRTNRSASQETRRAQKSRRHSIQHLSNVRRRRKDTRHLRQGSVAPTRDRRSLKS